MIREQAVNEIRALLSEIRPDSPDPLMRMGAQIRDAADRVRSRYAPIFARENQEKLTAEDFRGFLLFRNNQHWDSMHRQGGWMTADMPRLRDALRLLTD